MKLIALFWVSGALVIAGTIRFDWGALDALRGRDVDWADGHGRAEGIDGEGRLLVGLDDGTTAALSAGEVHLASVG